MALRRLSALGELILILAIIIIGYFVLVPALEHQVRSRSAAAKALLVPSAGTKVVLSEDYGVRFAGEKDAGNGDMTFAFGDECWVQHDGTLTVLCGDAGGILASYSRPRDDSFGSLCPVNVPVFIDTPLWQRLQDEKTWLAQTRAAMEKLARTCGK
jgi:hypothetical protein